MIKLLSVKEAATVAGVPEARILAWHREGKLPHVVRESGRPRFVPGQVLRLVHGVCLLCGTAYKRGNLRQQFCCSNCRKEASRLGVGKVLQTEGDQVGVGNG